MHKNDSEFNQKIIMIDEAYFHLGGYVKKQLFENVMEDLIKRAWSCKHSYGVHINYIVSHY